MVSLLEVTKVLNKNKKKLLKKGLTAVGIGYKVVSGRRTRNLCVVCSVARKKNASELSSKELIPGEIKGIKTDVIETGVIKALHTERHRPALGGISVGHVDITAGTLGCVVSKAGTRYLLSNSHVLACSGDANIGDNILQPGSHDGGAIAEDHFAELSAHVPINFSGAISECPISGVFVWGINKLLGLIRSKTYLQAIKQTEENLVDAAIAQPLKDSDLSNEILEIGEIKGTKSAILGMKIKKSGRTTGLTTGEITQTNVTVRVQYGEGKIAEFSDQIMAGKMCEGGDSGSAVFTDDNYIVGLLFAGSDTSMIASRIENVLDLLGCSINANRNKK